MEKKNEPGKQTKIAHLQYSKLELQEYLLDGNKNTEISKLIYKARGKNLDINTHKKWKYNDNLFIGCNVRIETEDKVLSCPGLSEQCEEITEEKKRKRLKRREQLLEEIT